MSNWRGQKLVCSAIMIFCSMQIAYGEDLARGKDLHDSNCISCHAALYGNDGTAIYTREDRKIDSYPALVKQIKRCKNSMGAPWPEDQIDDLLAYINNAFYKFEH